MTVARKRRLTWAVGLVAVVAFAGVVGAAQFRRFYIPKFTISMGISRPPLITPARPPLISPIRP
jgi:hypothetical protein